MNQSEKTRTIINNPGIPQGSSMARTTPGNPDIKNPPNNEGREAIVASRPKVGFGDSPKIDKWIEAPSGGTYVLGSVNGNIQWLQTETCGEE